MPENDRAQITVTRNQLSLLLGGLENLPSDMFAHADRSDRALLLEELAQIEQDKGWA